LVFSYHIIGGFKAAVVYPFNWQPITAGSGSN